MDSVREEEVAREEGPDTEAPAVYIRKAGSRNATPTWAPEDEGLKAKDNGTSSTSALRPSVPETPPAPGPPEFVPWVPEDEGLKTKDEGRPSRFVLRPSPFVFSPIPRTGDFDLPTVAPTADLSAGRLKARWVLLVFGVTLLTYWLFVNRIVLYSSPPTGDQAFYLMVTMSIVQDGDFNLANNYANHDEDKFYSLAPHPSDFVGMGAPYPLPPHNAFADARPPTEQYNFHWPGLSLLVAPAWVIGGLLDLWWPATVVFMCIIGALLATNIFLFAHELTGRTWIAVVVWAALVFSNPLMSYAYLIFSELTCGLLMLYALRRLALGWGANGPIRLVLVGICIACIPWVAWRCAPISFGLGIYALIQWWRRTTLPVASCQLSVDERTPPATDNGQLTIVRGPGGTPLINESEATDNGQLATDNAARFHALSSGLYLLTPVVISVALLAWYNFFLFGKLLPNNQTPERGDQPIFFWPWQGREELTHFVSSGYGMLFDRMFGLLPFAPVYLLAAVGFIAMFQSQRRSDRRLIFVMGLLVLPYLGILMSFFYWNGLWNPPARFQTSLVPLLAAPLAMALVACNNWIYRIIYALLSFWGFLMMSIMIADPRRLWPANAPYQWLANGYDYLATPPFPIRINLWNLLPAVDPLDQKSLPTNTAWVTIASMAVIVLGYFLMARWRKAQNRPHLPLLAQGATWAVVFALVAGSWYFTNFPYLQHRTTLTEVQRITATPGMVMARGIDYMDGKVYATDFQGKTVGVFDLAGSSYSLLHITDNGQPVVAAQPGDIKRGPDNNLYLLYNGGGPNDLLVIKPDGTVIKKMSLNGKSPTAVGLQFGPDGNIYVADVTGGVILEYNPTGGDPIARYTGKTSGFNNILGTLVTPDGEVYAAESSNNMVQEMKPGGDYVRSFALGCSPYYMAAAGDWIDVSCPGTGIISLNRATGNSQLSWTGSNNASPGSPTGMAYGPDGKLYVVDGSTLIVYTVQH